MRWFESSGSVLRLASRDVLTVPPTCTIKSAVELMMRHRFRRIPVTDPGSGRLLGILGSSDIVDLLGGGGKHEFISKAHRGNFLSAINDSVRRVMNKVVLTIDESSSGREALQRILGSRRGGLVVVDDESRVKGVVTERDFLGIAANLAGEEKVGEYMTGRVISTTPGTTIGDAAKMMVRNSFRRIPIVSEHRLVGMVTTRSLIRFIGENGIFEKMRGNRIDDVLSTRVSEVMKRDPAKMSGSSSIKDAVELMLSTGEGTVCVVEDERLAGILTERDVVRSIG